MNGDPDSYLESFARVADSAGWSSRANVKWDGDQSGLYRGDFDLDEWELDKTYQEWRNSRSYRFWLRFWLVFYKIKRKLGL